MIENQQVTLARKIFLKFTAQCQFFDEVSGKYRTYFNAIDNEVPEAKHDYKDLVNITDGATDADPDYEAEDSAMTLASGEEI